MENILAKINVPEELSSYIESLHYEVNSRSSLLTFAMGKGMGDTDAFKQYHDEYREFFMKYEVAKQELYDRFIRKDWDGQKVNCKLDFPTHTIYITEA